MPDLKNQGSDTTCYTRRRRNDEVNKINRKETQDLTWKTLPMREGKNHGRQPANNLHYFGVRLQRWGFTTISLVSQPAAYRIYILHRNPNRLGSIPRGGFAPPHPPRRPWCTGLAQWAASGLRSAPALSLRRRASATLRPEAGLIDRIWITNQHTPP